MPRISSCWAAASATTSGSSKRAAASSGPEGIERRVEGHRSDLRPEPVLAADDERLVDVELDAVARSDGAVHGERPLVVRQHGAQGAAVRASRFQPRAAEELDD